MIMTPTIAATSWSISIGGGWIVLMLIGMGLCFVLMLSSGWLMRNGRGWTMCGRWGQQEPPPTATAAGAPGERPDRTVSPASEAQP